MERVGEDSFFFNGVGGGGGGGEGGGGVEFRNCRLNTPNKLQDL